MSTDAERTTVLETKLDSFIEETRGNFGMVSDRVNAIEGRMTAIEGRMNVQIQVTVAMWVTTMIAVVATLAAVIVK